MPRLSFSDEDEEKYGENAINRVRDCPIQKLLKYCGHDAMLEYILARDQMEEVGYES